MRTSNEKAKNVCWRWQRQERECTATTLNLSVDRILCLRSLLALTQNKTQHITSGYGLVLWSDNMTGAAPVYIVRR